MRAVMVLAVVAGGCGDWPTYAADPVEDMVSSTTDPGSLFSLTWSAEDEVEDNQDSVLAQRVVLTADSGSRAVVVSGELARAGWNDSAEGRVVENPDCGAGTGSRSPVSPGDYAGDVDVFVAEIEAAGTLCARAHLTGSDTAIGWDLVAMPVDECGIPGAAFPGATGEPLGFDLGGEAGGWGLDVVAGDRVAVLFAAYDAGDPQQAIPYDLGLVLVKRGADQTGPSACPTVPSESPS